MQQFVLRLLFLPKVHFGETILVMEKMHEVFGFRLCRKSQKDDPQPSTGCAEKLSWPSEGRKLLLNGCVVVFWSKEHTKVLRKRVRDAGGCVEEMLGPATTHVVVPDHYGRCQIEKRLSTEGVNTNRLPSCPVFVHSEYLSESIGQGYLLDEHHYKINICQQEVEQPLSSASPQIVVDQSRKRDHWESNKGTAAYGCLSAKDASGNNEIVSSSVKGCAIVSIVCVRQHRPTPHQV